MLGTTKAIGQLIASNAFTTLFDLFLVCLQALRVPKPPVKSTVTGLIKCSQTNILATLNGF